MKCDPRRQPETEPIGRVFTRDELIAAMAGDDLPPSRDRTPLDERYLGALAAAFNTRRGGRR